MCKSRQGVAESGIKTACDSAGCCRDHFNRTLFRVKRLVFVIFQWYTSARMSKYCIKLVVIGKGEE